MGTPPAENGTGFYALSDGRTGGCHRHFEEKGRRCRPAVQSHFTEEMADVLMYYTEILICHGITPEEISEAYRTKHRRNMDRDYQTQYEKLFEE